MKTKSLLRLRHLIVVALAAFAAAGAQTAHAQMLASPAHASGDGRMTVGAAFAISTVEYDVVDEEDFDRKILAAELAMGVTRNVDAFLQAGYVVSADIDTAVTDIEGDGGFYIGGGARGIIHESRPLRVYGYGLLNFISEDYDASGSNLKAEVTMTELHLGVIAAYLSGSRVMPYGGLELIPLSDGDIKFKIAGISSKEDMERDDVLALRFGVVFPLTNAMLRADIALAGETTITLGAATSL